MWSDAQEWDCNLVGNLVICIYEKNTINSRKICDCR